MLIVVVRCDFFFFKQKTAYEMRISDCSSDVYSSDRRRARPAAARRVGRLGSRILRAAEDRRRDVPRLRRKLVRRQPVGDLLPPAQARKNPAHDLRSARRLRLGSVERSEEHTSELQSLMRISYAVFCLKKKKQN